MATAIRDLEPLPPTFDIEEAQSIQRPMTSVPGPTRIPAGAWTINSGGMNSTTTNKNQNV